MSHVVAAVVRVNLRRNCLYIHACTHAFHSAGKTVYLQFCIHPYSNTLPDLSQNIVIHSLLKHAAGSLIDYCHAYNCHIQSSWRWCWHQQRSLMATLRCPFLLVDLRCNRWYASPASCLCVCLSVLVYIFVNTCLHQHGMHTFTFRTRRMYTQTLTDVYALMDART